MCHATRGFQRLNKYVITQIVEHTMDTPTCTLMTLRTIRFVVNNAQECNLENCLERVILNNCI